MSDYDTDVICSKCCLSWSMTKDRSEGIYCPYCGTKQIKRSELFLKYEKLMKEDLARHRNNPNWTSCTDDYSYYYGIIDALAKEKLLSEEEVSLLHDLKEEFKNYRGRV